MAKLFKGKLASDQREMTIIEIDGYEPIRSWIAGSSADSAPVHTTIRNHVWRETKTQIEIGHGYTVRSAICADGGRGAIIRELRVERGAWSTLESRRAAMGLEC